ncbi:MAG: pncA [Gammaproteobacteria bacterium]|jgi:nicotinamidase/pyrazinamidase|nr:pncA [Gammaproteobacteria bacterium]
MYQLPEKSTVASLDVDAQKTFTPLCPHELPVPGGTEIVAELNAQAHFASLRLASKDSHSAQALWVADAAHPPLSAITAPHMDCYWPVHAVPGTLGFESLPGLPAIADYDYVVWKGVELDMHPYGACYHDLRERLSTGVLEFLKVHGIRCVIVGGLATEYCVKTTALQLRRGGLDVVVNLGACRGLDPEGIEAAIQQMKTADIAFVARAKELYQ